MEAAWLLEMARWSGYHISCRESRLRGHTSIELIRIPRSTDRSGIARRCNGKRNTGPPRLEARGRFRAEAEDPGQVEELACTRYRIWLAQAPRRCLDHRNRANSLGPYHTLVSQRSLWAP